MEKKSFQNTVSIIVIIALTLSVITLSILAISDNSYAEVDNTNHQYNSVTIPKEIRYGKESVIYIKGHKYNDVYSKYAKYIDLVNSGIKNDLSMFTDGETYYEMDWVKFEKRGSKPKTIYNIHHLSKMEPYQSVKIGKKMPAGKYTFTATYHKANVELKTYGNPSVYFKVKPNSEVNIEKTFYIKSKIKFVYNKKKGKLKKTKKTKYVAPTKKYGKLPTPKVKKGYKFVGWYTKKNGGKKVKSSTKVPKKNTVKLYARFKKA